MKNSGGSGGSGSNEKEPSEKSEKSSIKVEVNLPQVADRELGQEERKSEVSERVGEIDI